MSTIRDFFKNCFNRESVNLKLDNKSGQSTVANNKIANNINEYNNQTNIYIDGKRERTKEIYESVLNDQSSLDLREEIIPIENLITQGKPELAIQKFEALIDSPKFKKYSKDERFLIYNGLYNCHINCGSDEIVLEKYSQKIQALGELEGIHRYYFLLGVKDYIDFNNENALIHVRKSIELKPDYIKALTFEILVKATNEDITYEEGKDLLRELLKKRNLEVKEYATIHACYGDVAYNFGDFKTARKQYQKSQRHLRSFTREIAIATCDYYLSFGEIEYGQRVEFDKIDFEILKKAKSEFSRIYSEKTDETIHTIVRLALAYYISILVLSDLHEEILKIYDEIKDFIDDDMTEVLIHVAEAQVRNKILDKELLSKLDDYEQIKFEVLYYERVPDNDKVIELLAPIFSTKYKDKKILQFAYLVALQRANDFKKYMTFYQRFNADEEEIMRLNYIQFLEKREDYKKVREEIERLKLIAKNGFVLYDLMFFYLRYEMYNNLEEFFVKVDSGEYNIIGFQRPRVFFEKMLFLFDRKKFNKYLEIYEQRELYCLESLQKVILEINYYTIINDLNKLADTFYALFKITGNHNELLMAVQTKVDIGDYYGAEDLLDQMNPMELNLPEYYYMFRAVVLKEIDGIDKAFDELEMVVNNIEMKIDSPFHQFYVGFSFNNNKSDQGISYMNDYYAKNPKSDWFKVITYSENEGALELIVERRIVTGINDKLFYRVNSLKQHIHT